MAVTPNYGWPVPVATDYVKDGWEAISDLGNAIDTTVAGLGSGLNLIKSQTIGSAVSTVTVTNAFSATYDAYKIIISEGVGSADVDLNLTLGASATGYYSGSSRAVYSTAAASLGSNNNAAAWSCGRTNANGTSINFDLINPYLAVRTLIFGQFISYNTAGSAGVFAGFHNVATSYTDFTISPASGTLTGGKIRVYGYQLS